MKINKRQFESIDILCFMLFKLRVLDAQQYDTFTMAAWYNARI